MRSSFLPLNPCALLLRGSPRAAISMRRTFKGALAKYFADCCTPDAAYADALGSPTVAAAAATKERLLRAAFEAMEGKHGKKGGKRKGLAAA